MITKTNTTEISSYHNYRYNDVLCKELSFGTQQDDKFYLYCAEVNHPDEFPRISCNLFDKSGAKIAVIKYNKISYLHDDYTNSAEKDHFAISFKKNVVLQWKVVRYENVYVTKIEGELFDEKGGVVVRMV
jgi:hypothetical protein